MSAAALSRIGPDDDVVTGVRPVDLLCLLPIAAAVVAFEGEHPVIVASNGRFDEAGLGGTTDTLGAVALLGRELTTWRLSGEDQKFAWQFGSAVEPRHYNVSITRVPGKRPLCLLTLIDNTGEITTQQNLRREMTIDSLTGLPNRSGFGDRIEAMLKHGDRRFAVLVMDLDRFNRVNASLGGMAGDELLITVARRVKGALRSGDVLARIGGDEFGILIAIEQDNGEAEQTARRIRAALATPFRLSDYEIRIACSIGIALGHDDEEPEDVIRHAQFAMKRSKRSGVEERYQFKAFDVARERFAMETALRRAIEGNQLSLAFQPMCDLMSGRVHAFEALARWTTEDGRDVPPGNFIPVAEESGLIVPLGRWMIDQTVLRIADWDRRWGAGSDVQIAVNLSPLQISRDAVWDVVAQALERHGVDGRRLKIELTESALIEDADRVANALHALKALGCTIAMDDFGTGFSNLATLQALPIDVLKIDRSFVTTMLADRDKTAIVKATLGLAQALGMRTVAEGIETRELAQTLGALGCDYGQGYHFARPVRADAAYALLEARNR